LNVIEDSNYECNNFNDLVRINAFMLPLANKYGMFSPEQVNSSVGALTEMGYPPEASGVPGTPCQGQYCKGCGNINNGHCEKCGKLQEICQFCSGSVHCKNCK